MNSYQTLHCSMGSFSSTTPLKISILFDSGVIFYMFEYCFFFFTTRIENPPHKLLQHFLTCCVAHGSCSNRSQLNPWSQLLHVSQMPIKADGWVHTDHCGSVCGGPWRYCITTPKYLPLGLTADICSMCVAISHFEFTAIMMHFELRPNDRQPLGLSAGFCCPPVRLAALFFRVTHFWVNCSSMYCSLHCSMCALCFMGHHTSDMQ